MKETDFLLDFTERGFMFAKFTDGNDQQCSIQDSSVATESMLLPEGAMCAGRMHLTIEQATALLPLLKRFVKTGSISSKGN